MCFILPVSHIPCTHTISIWQHCIDATRAGTNGLTPCWNVQQHDRAILTRKHCENCGGARFFARRGGVAERGNGSPPAPLEEYEPSDHDEADDSGYHSDVIHEEGEEVSDHDELPLSPTTTAPPRLRTKQRTARKRRSSNHRPLNRKPSWKPNLKRELTLDDAFVNRIRRDSIDSMITESDDNMRYEPYVQAVAMERRVGITTTVTETACTAPNTGRPQPPKRRESTLLHPSSPPVETKFTVQTAKAFPFPRIIHIQKSSMDRSPTSPASKESLLSRPSTPLVERKPGLQQLEKTSTLHQAKPQITKTPRPAAPQRKPSTLLHPSCPPTSNEPAVQHERNPSSASRRPAIPTRKASTLLHPSPPPSPPRRHPAIPTRRMPTLFNSTSAPARIAHGRRESVLHSALSDSEDEAADKRSPSHPPDIKSDLDAYRFVYGISNHGSKEAFDDQHVEEVEGKLLDSTARVARANRWRVRTE